VTQHSGKTCVSHNTNRVSILCDKITFENIYATYAIYVIRILKFSKQDVIFCGVIRASRCAPYRVSILKGV